VLWKISIPNRMGISNFLHVKENRADLL
jgi:hypothetical protein